VPFGDYKVADPQFYERDFLIHDYFFAKGIEKVRPGGLIIFITSKGTLDKINSGLRDYLHDRANFLGAVRLPNTAFKHNANTEVTADIIFLRKLAGGEKPSGPAWLNLAEHVNGDGASFQINEYFASNPHMMLGAMAHEGTMYRQNEPALVPDGRDLVKALHEAIAHLPRGIYQDREQTNSPKTVIEEAILAPDYVKENAFTIHEDIIAVRTGVTLTPVTNLPDETARRIRGLIKVRDAVRETLRTQLQNHDEEAVINSRQQLNFRYDHFVSRFGAINDSANRRAFRGDPDLPLLCSLEEYNDETKKAIKTAIFRERTIHKTQVAEAAETAQDALVLTLNEVGRVDFARMQALLSRSSEEFLPELKGLIYRNPQTERWETDDQYLSGDVRTKLKDARAAAAADSKYQENVTALEAVQLADLSASEIDARLGAVWIPSTDIETFAKSLLGSDGITVQHAAQVGTWFVRGDYGARATIANTTEWGTTRYSALELIQDALNLKTPTVYDTDPKTDARVINAQQTEAARNKLEKIKERFKT
jgi:N12 class adenine-specific DNA methylase